MALYFDVNGTVKEVNGWAGEGGGGGSVEPDMMIVPVGEGTSVMTYADLMTTFSGRNEYAPQYALDPNKLSLETKLLIITHELISAEGADMSMIHLLSGSSCFNLTKFVFMEIDPSEAPIEHQERLQYVSFDSQNNLSDSNGTRRLVTQHLEFNDGMTGCSGVYSDSNSSFNWYDMSMSPFIEPDTGDDEGEVELTYYAVVLYNGVGSIKQIKTAVETTIH